MDLRCGAQKRYNPPRELLAILAALSVSIALADDFKTIDGKEYKNVKVSRIEPDGIVVTFSGGIVKPPFAELRPEIQTKYGYNPEAAGDFQRQAYEMGLQRAREISEGQQKQAEERARYWSEHRAPEPQRQAPEQQQEQAAQTGVPQQIIDRQQEILFLLGKVHRPGMSVVLPSEKEQAALWKEYLRLQVSRGDLSEQARQDARDELAAIAEEERNEEIRQLRARASQAEADAAMARGRN